MDKRSLSPPVSAPIALDATVGVLLAGRTHPELAAEHGEYGRMFERMLTPLAPGLRLRFYDVVDEHPPGSPSECEGWLISGSKSGVYDPEPWIPRLEAFLADAYAADAPLVGICFGHQILAQALGGRVVKSEKGWGCGLHDYDWAGPGSGPAGARLALHAMHQDQVVDPPAGATILARSAFCPYAALAYGDPQKPAAISVQPHPEFEAAFVSALIRRRRGDGVPEAVAQAALASVRRPAANRETALWILAFLRRRITERRGSE